MQFIKKSLLIVLTILILIAYKPISVSHIKPLEILEKK